MKRLAHLSDLHLGKSAETRRRAEQLAVALADNGVDRVVVSGDVTHRGLKAELALFRQIFGPWLMRGAMTVVPGNHDRLGDNVAEDLMNGRRVQVDAGEGLAIIGLDSTAEHNKSRLMPHGVLDDFDLAALVRTLSLVPPDVVRVVVLHHHPLPLPEDGLLERIGGWLRVTQVRSLSEGGAFLDALAGNCDLVLHGHRHVPAHVRLSSCDRELDIYNGGSSTALGAFRVMEHDAARVHRTRWIAVGVDDPDARKWRATARGGSDRFSEEESARLGS